MSDIITAEQAAELLAREGDIVDATVFASAEDALRSVIALTAQLAKANARADAAFALGLDRAAKAGGDAAVEVLWQKKPNANALEVKMTRQSIANPIRALTPMTPLAAALQLPEVRELMDYAAWADAELGSRFVHELEQPRRGLLAALAALTAAGGGE